MFRNLTVNTVRGAPLNLAITADLEQYIAKQEGGVLVVNRVADYKRLLDSLSGGKQVTNRGQEPMHYGRLPYKDLKET